jgi:hypothetical protein
MAKKRVGGITRSQAIRNYLRDENPSATPKQIVEAMKERGINVTTGLASNVKYSKRKPEGQAGKRTAGRGNNSTASAPTRGTKFTTRTMGRSALTGDDLLEAKKLADQLGGIEKVREALGILEQLR